MNMQDPKQNAATIVFFIVAFFMAIYMIFVYHMKHVHAQDLDAGIPFYANIPTDAGLKDISGILKPVLKDDPFVQFDAEDALDTDPLTGILDAGGISQRNIDYHFAIDNPYYKEGYDFNWRAHSDYEYFVWLEADHRKTREELQQLEYEKIRLQKEISVAVLYNLVHCVRAIDDFGVLNPNCTNDKFGCEERVYALVGYIIEVAYDLNLDPWLLTAIAMHESTFNPFAVGPVGERGYFQINPRIPMAKKLKFVRSERYRRHCKRELGNCQNEIAKAAAVHLYKDFKRCDDNVYKALTRYNTGSCLFHGHVRRKYVKSVMRLKARLLQKKPKINWCDPSRNGKTDDYYI